MNSLQPTALWTFAFQPPYTEFPVADLPSCRPYQLNRIANVSPIHLTKCGLDHPTETLTMCCDRCERKCLNMDFDQKIVFLPLGLMTPALMIATAMRIGIIVLMFGCDRITLHHRCLLNRTNAIIIGLAALHVMPLLIRIDQFHGTRRFSMPRKAASTATFVLRTRIVATVS